MHNHKSRNMKIFLLIIAATVTNAQSNSLRHSIITNERSEGFAIPDENSEDILFSGKCTPMFNEITTYMSDLVNYFSDEEICEWACNDVQREKSKAREHAKARDIDTQGNSCIKSLEEKEVKVYKKDHLDEVLDDYAACAAKVGTVLTAWKTSESVPDVFITEHSAFAPVLAVPLFLISILIPLVPPPP